MLALLDYRSRIDTQYTSTGSNMKNVEERQLNHSIFGKTN